MHSAYARESAVHLVSSVAIQSARYQSKPPTDCSDIAIFERSKVVSQECWHPEDIVIGKEGERGVDLLEPLDHLQAFVCFACIENLDMRKIKFLANLSNMANPRSRSHNNHGSGMAGGDAKKASAKANAVCQRRDDHRHVRIGVSRYDWKGG